MQSNRYFSGLTLFNLLADSQDALLEGAVWLTFVAENKLTSI